jgi:acyl-[acyl carrier protein]--UDP-N-acetylglucosamine O-acyltransferase
MKRKIKKKRIEEIEEVYKTLGLQSEEARRYFAALGNIPVNETQVNKISIFIEADTGSFGSGEITNA